MAAAYAVAPEAEFNEGTKFKRGRERKRSVCCAQYVNPERIFVIFLSSENYARACVPQRACVPTLLNRGYSSDRRLNQYTWTGERMLGNTSGRQVPRCGCRFTPNQRENVWPLASFVPPAFLSVTACERDGWRDFVM